MPDTPWSIGLTAPPNGWRTDGHPCTIGNRQGPLGEAELPADAALWTLAWEMAEAIQRQAQFPSRRSCQMLLTVAGKLRQIGSA